MARRARMMLKGAASSMSVERSAPRGCRATAGTGVHPSGTSGFVTLYAEFAGGTTHALFLDIDEPRDSRLSRLHAQLAPVSAVLLLV